MTNELLAYLAGAIDSDGSIGIRRSTYHQRVRGDARAPVYSERVGLKQVTPQIPELLKECFGGHLGTTRSQTANGRDLLSWQVTDKAAAECLRALLPFLRVKRAQAENCLALRASKDRPRLETHVRRDQPTVSLNRWGESRVHRLEVSPETLAEREALYIHAKELNRVGV